MKLDTDLMLRFDFCGNRRFTIVILKQNLRTEMSQVKFCSPVLAAATAALLLADGVSGEQVFPLP